MPPSNHGLISTLLNISNSLSGNVMKLKIPDSTFEPAEAIIDEVNRVPGAYSTLRQSPNQPNIHAGFHSTYYS